MTGLKFPYIFSKYYDNIFHIELSKLETDLAFYLSAALWPQALIILFAIKWMGHIAKS